MDFTLIPHSQTPCPEVSAISVNLTRDERRFELNWRIEGDIAALVIPAAATPKHTDGLWQHLCVELFVMDADGPGYTEYNFSPSGQWAAYRFDDYRAGMREWAVANAPEIVTNESARALFVKVELPGFYSSLQTSSLRAERGNPDNLPHRGLLRRFTPRNDDSQLFALSAVIETKNGTKSYWALAHPPGKPDFHHADCFIGAFAATDHP